MPPLRPFSAGSAGSFSSSTDLRAQGRLCRPGTDSALFGAVLHELIRHDWLDHHFIDAHTSGFEAAAEGTTPDTRSRLAEILEGQPPSARW